MEAAAVAIIVKQMFMKVVIFFCIFDAIGAMVLLISSKQIELEGCACAQIEAHEA